MKIVVIGGTGLIGSKVVAGLREEDHEVVAASPDSGVNTLTGEELSEVVDGASVVIDVSNSLRASPSRRSLRGESGAPGGPASTSAQYPPKDKTWGRSRERELSRRVAKMGTPESVRSR